MTLKKIEENDIIVPKSEIKEQKEIMVVVKELPLRPIRKDVLEDGTNVTYITTEEALNILIKNVRV